MTPNHSFRLYFLFNLLLIQLIIIFCSIIYSDALAANSHKNTDPISLYGQEIYFKVFRNGNHVGEHQVRFSLGENGQLIVITNMSIVIKVFGLTIYTFIYKSESEWLNGKLYNLDSEYKEGRSSNKVAVTLDNNTLYVNGPDGVVNGSENLLPTNHWNARVLSHNQVINTLNGNISNVSIKNVGREYIVAQGKSVEAERYEYTGDITASLWYDDEGRWLKMSFVKDRSVIDYECVICGK